MQIVYVSKLESTFSGSTVILVLLAFIYFVSVLFFVILELKLILFELGATTAFLIFI